jgi:LysM repeat protein
MNNPRSLMMLVAGLAVAVLVGGCATAKQKGAPAAPAAAAAAAPAPVAAPVTPAPAKPADDIYTVQRGNCLWCIAGKKEIYGNPYQWPLIYRANKDQIKDADLIYPNQKLKIDRNASKQTMEAAIKHARTRGAWKIGKVEATDTAFLKATP